MVRNREELKNIMLEIGKIYTKHGLNFGEIEYINERIKEATREWYREEYKKGVLIKK